MSDNIRPTPGHKSRYIQCKKSSEGELRKIDVKEALETIDKSEALFEVLFDNGAGSTAEIYRPERVDNQTPHDRDEYYVVISGTGEFLCDGERVTFAPGDLLFVAKGVDHRFENFSEDFATWVIFV